MTNNTHPRAYTKEEAREKFLNHIRAVIHHWANERGMDEHSKLDGLAFSILNIFDGATGLPAMDIALRPHEDDAEYMRSEGDNWYEPGMVINDDVMLHELWVDEAK